MAQSNARPRPMPAPTRTTQPFWDAVRRKTLMLQYDPASRSYQFWPRSIGVRSGKQKLEWREVSGRGTVYSFTETHVPTAGFEDRAPYLVALVELEEGVRIMTNLVNIDLESARIGMRVRVTWEELPDDGLIYAFEPAD